MTRSLAPRTFWLLAVLLAPPSHAEETTSDFTFGGAFSSRFIADFYRPDGGKFHAGLSNDSELQIYANYQSWLSVNADLKLERNRDVNLNSYYPDRHAIFRSEGLTLRQLYLTLRPADDLAFHVGKIHPDFGASWSWQPGIFYGFGTDFEQDERIGLGAEWRANGTGGEYKISAQVFYLDTTVLSNSVFSRPSPKDPVADRLRRYTRAQFGPSNTGSLNSVTIALDGQHIPLLPGVQYHLAYTHQATDEPGARAENGVSLAAKIDPTGSGIPLTSRLGLVPFVEYAYLANFGTIAGLTRTYLLGGASLMNGDWGLHAAAGARINSGVASGTDYQVNLSATYDLGGGLQVGAGINHLRLEGRHSTGFAPMLSYRRTF